MAVPETAVDENDGPILGQDQVRPSGKTHVMQSKTKAGRMQHPPYCHLGLCVFSLYTGHHPAARSGVDDIRQLAGFPE